MHNGIPGTQHFTLYPGFTVEIYPASIHRYENVDFFIARKENVKYLFGVTGSSSSFFDKFQEKEVYKKNTDVPKEKNHRVSNR